MTKMLIKYTGGKVPNWKKGGKASKKGDWPKKLGN